MSKKKVIMFQSFPDLSGNAKTLYEFINKKHKNKFDLYWVVSSDEVAKQLDSLLINNVVYNSNDYHDKVKETAVFFDTHGQFIDLDTTSALYVNLWHGIPLKNLGYMMNDLTVNDMIFLKKISEKTDIMPVSSSFCATIFSAVFNLNFKKLKVLGMPRIDDVYNSCGAKKMSEIIGKNVKKYNKILIYLPTFRNGLGRKNDGYIGHNNILNLLKYDEKKLIKYLEKNNYLLLIKYHPSENSQLTKINSDRVIMLTDELLMKNKTTLNEILGQTQLLITDYSSVYFDYVLLEKPILFLNTDINEYKKNRGFVFNDLSLWFPGPQVNNINNVIIEIDKLLKYKNKYFENERKNFSNLIFQTKKNNCKKLFEYIFVNDDFTHEIKNILKEKYSGSND